MSIWKEAIRVFRERLFGEYQENLVAVILFGSAARGELDEESDIDVLVVLRDYKDFWKEFRTISDIAYDISMGTDFQVLISPVLVAQEEYERSRGGLPPQHKTGGGHCMKEVEELITKAKRSLKAAWNLFGEEDYDFAVSRAYYAMFYMAEAVLLTKGLTFSKHKGVIAGFWQHFVN